MVKQRGTSPLFILVATVTAVAALYFAKEILLPLGLAVLLSFLLTPVANRLESLRLGRWQLGRIPATLLVVVMSFAILGGLGYIVTTQLIDLRWQLPDYKEKVIAKIRSVAPNPDAFKNFYESFQDIGKELADDGNSDRAPASVGKSIAKPAPGGGGVADPPAESEKQAAEPTVEIESDAANVAVEATRKGDDGESVEVKVVEMPLSPLAQVRDWLGPLVAPLGTAGIVVVLVFFMLLNRENQRNRLLQLFGTSNLHVTTQAIHDATYRVGRYLRMQFLINAGYGIAVGIGLWLIGVPGAALWGVLGFSLRFLPYIGPWIAAALPFFVSLGHFDSWTQPLLVAGWFVVLELVLNNAVEPWVYGSTTGVSAVGVILSAIFWTWLWGPVGLILAMPITVCLVAAARYVPELRFLTVLLADQPPLTLSERIYQRLLAYDYNEPAKLAHKHLTSASLLSFYDDALIPALVLAEHDRHADLLNDDQERFVTEAAEDLVEELGEHHTAMQAKEGETSEESKSDTKSHGAREGEVDVISARVLCVPLRDEADETVARMLSQLLAAEGFHVETGGADSLASEIVDRVAKMDIDLVVISILPPIAPRDSRLLWKRLRTRYPNLPIVVGFWHGAVSREALAPPENDVTSRVATSLAEAISHVRAIAVERRLTAKTG